MMKNIFTIDTEDWFHANYEDGLFQNDASLRRATKSPAMAMDTNWYISSLRRRFGKIYAGAKSF